MSPETHRRPSRAPRPACTEYPAALYAAVHTGNPGDVDFYRRACAAAESVLELGVGAGRVAQALAADGLEVVGLDRDGGLLELARCNAPGVELVHADMRDFDLGRRFDRVLIPYNGLYCLLRPEDLRDCLRCARAHLKDGGLLVFDGYSAELFHAEAEGDGSEDAPGLVRTVDALGTSWDVFEHSRWDRAEQRIDAVYTHVPRDGRPAVSATIPQRYVLADELEALLASCGLDLVVLHGSWDQEAFDLDSRLLIATATPRTARA
ncbi:MAG TPA: class I SAM-dependent methyltransferase [Polyangiaceae bacterium LLY-WYZ-15_(1-7)]|nr:class I SAM-dependent methyltransferase [Polyangiaceae bacterium LLY-WYZ-15_(1-7)]HJL00949.1 class I SAM-dependent methyltransferase [Polyangiaceae bacterium LLY-WYZ-15_(1-7)]HJL07263.1 class I SAM-dependent methyltransferase [Polyangiaceae bacterium LLY-WYZ-15_(1-7)]HJL21225.1 class I SAM-dependent methyltransferase [Polyangiaceae bacterium LLY-WYZ-15_(1-7)]HJL31042.1 class I SAM-dependent methyltransferase [Polyangiaceae bacterium LLY-WYZ-15_(1-7)]